MKIFSKDEFAEIRIVYGNNGAKVGTMGGLGGSNGMRMERTGNLLS